MVTRGRNYKSLQAAERKSAAREEARQKEIEKNLDEYWKDDDKMNNSKLERKVFKNHIDSKD